MRDELFIGISCGVSGKGVDTVLVNFSRGSMDILHARSTPYPPAIRLTLDQLRETGEPPSTAVADLLDENLGRFFARIAQNLAREAGMEMRDIRAIGSQGQNVWHQPHGAEPASNQLGKGRLIARNTSTTVVNNFGSADLEAGGRGAPLSPLLHEHLFRSEAEDRAVLHIGGMARLALLPVNGAVAGFDSGPGNCLMDSWASIHLHKDYDEGGKWARKGTHDTHLLGRLLDDPHFRLRTPGSNRPGYFNETWLEGRLKGDDVRPVDVQATLTELTAVSVANSLADGVPPQRLLVCGGGTHNAFLMRRLAAALPDTVVESTARHGADPDWVRGLLFAWLARERLNGSTQDTRSLTGADQPVLLGDIHIP